MKLEIIAATTFGLEAVAKREIEALGYKILRAEDGKITFMGDERAVARANLWLRTADRVQIKMAEFEALEFEDLFQQVKAIAWEEWIPPEGKFIINGSSVKSKLSSVPACQSIAEKAIVEKLRECYGIEHFEKSGALYDIKITLLKNRVTVTLDTTGPGLHKRGYRQSSVEAPIKETLAAAMVTLSRFRGRDPFCDPFCGSGTICIEAALIALNRAPGLDRSFDAQRWGFVPSGDWLAAAGEAMDKEFHGKYDIWGGDVDPRAVAIARDNARKAGVEDVVRFEVADMRNFRREDTYGQLVTNPPYGERLLERQEAEALYRDFGHMWERLPDTWRTLVLSSHTEFERTFGHQAKKKRKLYNGMIKCDLFMYGNV